MNLTEVSERLVGWVEEASAVVWGPFLLIPLLLATGLFLTVRLSGLQFRQLGPALSSRPVDPAPCSGCG